MRPPPQLLLLLAVVVGVLEPNKACLTRDTGISVPYYASLFLQVLLRSNCYCNGTLAFLCRMKLVWRNLLSKQFRYS